MKFNLQKRFTDYNFQFLGASVFIIGKKKGFSERIFRVAQTKFIFLRAKRFFLTVLREFW